MPLKPPLVWIPSLLCSSLCLYDIFWDFICVFASTFFHHSDSFMQPWRTWLRPAACAHPTGRSSACCPVSRKNVGRLRNNNLLLLHHTIFINKMLPWPSTRSGVEIQVVCNCWTGRGLQRKRRRRRVTEKENLFLTLPPSTLHLWFKALTPTAALGCHRPLPCPPLTCIVTSPAPPTPPP